MAPPTFTRRQPIPVRAEPCAVLARGRLGADDVAGAHQAIRAALDTLRILGPTQSDTQPVSTCLKPVERQLKSETVQFNWNGDPTCRIDAEAVAAIVRTAIENAQLSGDAVLLVEVDGDAEPPLVELVFDGPGSIPETWFVGGIAPIPFEELRLHWTRHTGGARLDRTEKGVALKFVGQREPEPNPDEHEAVFAAVVEAERVLRLAVSDGAVPKADVVQTVLDAMDAESPGPEPADVRALLRGVLGDDHTSEILCSDSVPPVTMRRDRVAVSLERLCILARPRMEAGAKAVVRAVYNAPDRAVEMECTFPRAGDDVAWEAACAAFERVISALHNGIFMADLTADQCAISLTLPDPIGAALNDWIPGFDVFSERSIQMLRLLKSGGQAPPEDLILGGVLESELERWLMATLEESPAVNVAHELDKGKNPPRVAKALGQIRKGKPKKEICAPSYAAEIIGAYRVDERGRRALGLASFETEEIDALLNGLTSEPLGYLTCLRLLVKITRVASG